MKDGTVNKCKACNKIDVYKNKEDNIEKVRNYDRNRPNRDIRNKKISARAKHRYHNDENYKLTVAKKKNKWVANNPSKRSAQCAANNALRNGKLERKYNCEHCDKHHSRLHKHHWSYLPENWLDIVWLCPSCHGAEHKRLNEIGRDPDKEEK